MELKFERLEDNRWYVVLSDYEGNHEDLEMVDGADRMCAALSDDNMYLTLNITLDEPNEGDYFSLEMEAHDDYGAHYNVLECDQFSDTIWLCNVTHFVFGEHPEKIYCQVID